MEEKVFELLTKMYSEMTEKFMEINNKLDKKAEKSDIVRLENDHGKKLDSLFDGYKLLADFIPVNRQKCQSITTLV